MPLDPALFLAFLAAGIALNLTPGADMTLIAAQSLGKGREAGLAASLGVGAGALTHAALAAVGLAALVAASPWMFDVIRYAGAAYLIWMAVLMIRKPPEFGSDVARGRANHWTSFRQGMLTNLLNPKVIVFVLAFLPQFVDPARAPVGLQILLLGAIFALTGTMILCAVALTGGQLRRFVSHHPCAPKWLSWMSGTLIGGLAIGLLLSGRRVA